MGHLSSDISFHSKLTHTSRFFSCITVCRWGLTVKSLHNSEFPPLRGLFFFRRGWSLKRVCRWPLHGWMRSRLHVWTGWPYVHIYWEISWALACGQITSTLCCQLCALLRVALMSAYGVYMQNVLCSSWRVLSFHAGRRALFLRVTESVGPAWVCMLGGSFSCSPEVCQSLI